MVGFINIKKGYKRGQSMSCTKDNGENSSGVENEDIGFKRIKTENEKLIKENIFLRKKLKDICEYCKDIKGYIS